MPILTIQNGPLAGKRFKLPGKTPVCLGRDPTCQIVLPDDRASRKHCLIGKKGSRWVVKDLESSNHTLVNNVAVPFQELGPGDVIQIGNTLLSFLASPQDSLLTRMVGGYRIDSLLGKGSMGTVYLARQLSLARNVALKILVPSLARDAEFVARFIHEARAAARLNHPNIVQIYDNGSDGDNHFISMEYVPGGSLNQLLLEEKALGYRQVGEIGVGVLDALSFAESRGIVHRDIKPGNLLLTEDGSAKISDLGIARDLKQSGVLCAQRIAGSPTYMAPEQARQKEVDHRADIYALGVTIYHTVAGVPPFQGSSLKEIVTKKEQAEFVSLKQRVPTVPARFSTVVSTMMAAKPEDRYPCAADARSALAAAARGGPQAPRKAVKKFRRTFHRRATSLVKHPAVILLVVLLGSLVYFSSPGDEPDPNRPVAGNPRPPPDGVYAPPDQSNPEQSPPQYARSPEPNPNNSHPPVPDDNHQPGTSQEPPAPAAFQELEVLKKKVDLLLALEDFPGSRSEVEAHRATIPEDERRRLLDEIDAAERAALRGEESGE